jgi:hypothetical protein
LARKAEEKIPEVRLRHNNNKMNLREIGWGGMDSIVLAQDRDQKRALVKTVMNLWVPKMTGKLLSSCTTGGFSRRARLHEDSFVS